MKKRLCILQVTPSEPNKDHIDLFKNKSDCDFFFVTHDNNHPDALKFCPETTWTDTRNILAELVPKEYEYYAFVDYDYILRPQRGKNALEQIYEDLEEYEPAVLTYYPGEGLITPFATDKDYYESSEYSIIPFTHCGLKIVHHSLMDWFFPMVTKFGGGVEACHLFNILEIPLLGHVVCSHKMLYDNGVTDLETPHNVNPFESKLNMDKMWAEIRPHYKKLNLLTQGGYNIDDSLSIKSFFVSLFKEKGITPVASNKGVDYYDEDRISRFFDTENPLFYSIR